MGKREALLRKVLVVKFMKKMRRVTTLILALVMALTMTTAAFAAETPTEPAQMNATDEGDYGIMPLLNSNTVKVGDPHTKWEVVASAPGGFDCVVTLQVKDFDPVWYQLDVIVNGNSGKIYSEDNCTKLGDTFAIALPKSATTVLVRIQPRASLITKDKGFEVTATW